MTASDLLTSVPTAAGGSLPVVLGSEHASVETGIFEAARDAAGEHERPLNAVFADSDGLRSLLPAGWMQPITRKWSDRAYNRDGDLFEDADAQRDLASVVNQHVIQRGLPYGDPDPLAVPSRRVEFEVDFDAAASVVGGLAALPADERQRGVDALREAASRGGSVQTQVAADAVAATPEATATDWEAAVREHFEDARRWAAVLAHAEAYEFYLDADRISDPDPELVELAVDGGKERDYDRPVSEALQSAEYGDSVTAEVNEYGGVTVTVSVLARPIRYGDRVTVEADGAEIVVEATHRVPLTRPDLPYRWVVWAGDVQASAHPAVAEGDFVGVGAAAVRRVERGDGLAASAPERAITAEDPGERHAALLAAERDGLTATDFTEHVSGLVELLPASDPFVRRTAYEILDRLASDRTGLAGTEAVRSVADRLLALAREGEAADLAGKILSRLAARRPEAMAAHGEAIAATAVEHRNLALVEALQSVAEHRPEVLAPHVDAYLEWLLDGPERTTPLEEALADAVRTDPSIAVEHVDDAHVERLLDADVGSAVLTAIADAAPSLLAAHVETIAEQAAETGPELLESIAEHDSDALTGYVDDLVDRLPASHDESTAYARVLARIGDAAPGAVAEAASEIASRPAVWRDLRLDAYNVGVVAPDDHRELLDREGVAVESRAALRDRYDDREDVTWDRRHENLFSRTCPECDRALDVERVAQTTRRDLVAELRCRGSDQHASDYRWIGQIFSGTDWFFDGTLDDTEAGD